MRTTEDHPDHAGKGIGRSIYTEKSVNTWRELETVFLLIAGFLV